MKHPKNPKNQKNPKKTTRRLLLAAALLLIFSALAAAGFFFVLFVAPTLGVERVTVPDCLGLREDAAAGLFDPARYTLSVEYRYDGEVPAGVVLSQNPPAGAARKVRAGVRRCAVTLSVSLGVETAEVPSLAGLTVREAKRALAARGFSVLAEGEDGDTVLRQTPVPGEKLAVGGTVTLVSRAPLPQIRIGIVPALMGLSAPDADVRLLRAGFVPGTVTYRASAAPEGTVLRQTRPAGAHLPAGTVVSYTLSDGSLAFPDPAPGSEPESEPESEDLPGLP